MLICMRTTIHINDDLFQRAKMRAVEGHTTFTFVVENALRAWLKINPDATRRTKVNVPTSGSDGLLPGVDLDSTASLLDRMDDIS